MVKRCCVSLAGLALVLGALATTSPAMAGTTGHTRPAAGAVNPGGPLRLVVGSHGVHRASVTSKNWSGYASTGGTFHSVSASWVEPSVNCAGTTIADAAFWVGIDGDGSKTVEQLGSMSECAFGTASYSAWWEMYPNPSNTIANTVKPGDHFSASVTNTSGGSFTLKITDSTQRWSHTYHKSSTTNKDASAEAIVEAPSSLFGILPLSDFGTAHFTHVNVDGAAIGNTNPDQITMVDSSGKPEDSVSALTGGNAFTATWKSSTKPR
ncbi:MAG TPA: G1 family glutamic endopeptidase [Streptosporangiaceae bacterium]|nr:G1 family glutamic endopeptidase [Streptosporangiaceae bacterium]